MVIDIKAESTTFIKLKNTRFTKDPVSQRTGK